MRYIVVRRWHLAVTFAALLLLGVFAGTAVQAHTQRIERKEKYTLMSGNVRTSPYTVVFRGKCIEAEDSAAHVVLKEYGQGWAVYGCAHAGY